MLSLRIRQPMALLALIAALVSLSAIGVRDSEAGSLPLTFVVDTTDADEGGGGPALTACTAAAGDCSLRGAITRANSHFADSPNTINFSIGVGGQTITLTKALPAITGPVIVDGRTQRLGGPVFCFDFVHAPCIHISGSGLVIQGGDSKVLALSINNTSVGLRLESSNNVLDGNFIGTPDGVTAGNTGDGIIVDSPFDNNIIGSTGSRPRNVIASSGFGIINDGSGTVIKGNYVGTNKSGTAALPNSFGIIVEGGDAVIGGAGSDANVISGNAFTGVAIQSGADGEIAGNIIGLGADGSAVIGNSDYGVKIGEARNTTVGSADPTMRNIISGNGHGGVEVLDQSKGVQVLNNYIGTDVTGTLSRPNGGPGVLIDSSSNNIIGAPGMGNLISGNSAPLGSAITIQAVATAANDNVVQTNLIGTDVTGNTGLTNTDGVLIEALDPALLAAGNLIGGDGQGEGNVIAASFQTDQVKLSGPGVSGTVVAGNIIGLAADGDTDIPPNGGAGVFISDSGHNTIGGASAGSRNIISGNGDGVDIRGHTADGNIVRGNYIGTDVTGLLDRGNDFVGVLVVSAQNTIVANNVISGNMVGIGMNGANATAIKGNFIGVAADGSPLGNDHSGVQIQQGGADGQTIGGSGGDANVIANNAQRGVFLIDNTPRVRIARNSIHDNGLLGIEIEAGSNNDQPAPMLTAAESGSHTRVAGTLAGVHDKAYVLEFFSSPDCDPSGFGEGQTFIGSSLLTANAAGIVTIDVTNLDETSPGDSVTATATDENGNTSEFSNCVAVVAATPTPTPSASPTATTSPTGLLGDGDCDGDVDLDDVITDLKGAAGIEPGACDRGDADCDGRIDGIDALRIVRHLADLPMTPPPHCRAIAT